MRTGLLAPSFLVALMAGSLIAAPEKENSKALLGATDFCPSPEHPIGWRGDWTGRFPGATPPTNWSRKVKDFSTGIFYQARKPNGEAKGNSENLNYFTVKDWLVIGPFPSDNPAKDIGKDFLGNEAEVQPDEGQKVGQATWKFHRANEETQSRKDYNSCVSGQFWVDFVYIFGKITTKTEWRTAEVEGDLDRKVAYAHTYIWSDRNRQVGIGIRHEILAVKVWLNGKAEDIKPLNHISADPTFSATLKKGWNRLMVKVVCDKALKGDRSSFLPQWRFAAYIMPPGVNGKDGTLEYETKNIGWITKLTGRSMSQPIVVGEKIFVGANISDLFCLDSKSGEVLWMHASSAWDALTAEERAPLKDKIEPLVKELASLNEQAIKQINAGVCAEGMNSEQQKTLNKLLGEKHRLECKLHDAFFAADPVKFKGKLYQNEVSAANATPVSDGQHVYWVSGGGWQGGCAGFLISCFSLDGTRTWSRYILPNKWDEHGAHTSPVLVDGKLIFNGNSVCIALDTKTGKTVWEDQDCYTRSYSPTIVTVAGSRAILTKSKLLKLDGTALGPGDKGNTVRTFTPIVEGNTLFHATVNNANSPDFEAEEIGSSGPARKWILKSDDIYGSNYEMPFTIASPLFVDGLVYLASGFGRLTVIDTRARKVVYSQWLDGYTRYHRWLYGICASPTLGGRNIYVVDGSGYATVVEPGAKYKTVARNVIENVVMSQNTLINNPCQQEPFAVAPYFDGSSIYLRGDESLYCIRDSTR